VSSDLLDIVASKAAVPVSWVTPPAGDDYLNLGDALSPVIVAMMSGLPVTHVPSKSSKTRLAAVGTIGHMMAGGHVHVWGTGTSPNLNPGQHGQEKVAYGRPDNTRFTFHATRGPFSRRVLGAQASDPAVFGDPLWLLPHFHDAPREKTHELGVILHLAELSERTFDARPKDTEGRHHVSASEKGSVKLINTVTPTTIPALRQRLDEILSCKRIVSTSLHGMVFAESYGIPCLYFSPRSRSTGLGRVDLSDESGVIDLRFVDLYRGLGLSELDVWYQPRNAKTDWQAVIAAIDRVWARKVFDDRPLINAFPLPLAMMGKGSGGSAFDAPLIASLPTKRKRLPGQAFIEGLAGRFLR
jgi:hypothetical protein